MTYRVCFVCTGNICRSPMAERVFASMVADAGLSGAIVVDSAGTGGWHVGGGADPRAVRTLTEHGYDGRGHVARQLDPSWFAERDLIVALDSGHLADLRAAARDDRDSAKVVLLRAYDPLAMADGTLDVEDPYYDGESGFADRLAQIEQACAGLLRHIRDELGR
ncbi:MAG: low molecular weight protein-tyrosine-phosphatase [Mycobacteriales bacterium]